MIPNVILILPSFQTKNKADKDWLVPMGNKPSLPLYMWTGRPRHVRVRMKEFQIAQGGTTGSSSKDYCTMSGLGPVRATTGYWISC